MGVKVSVAVYYLNKGVILEQAIKSLIHDYLETVDVDEIYRNFHVEVTNSHPFASLYLHNNSKAADSFPAIVVSTQNDGKTAQLSQLSAEIRTVGLTAADIENLTSNKYKKDFTDITGKKHKAGEKIPGYCAVTSKRIKEELIKAAEETGYVYGYDVTARRTDRIGIDIWADNDQVKNELYEMVRLFVTGGLPIVLSAIYSDFDPSIFDDSLNGQRSGNYNLDFDVQLSGSMITFDVNYCIKQIIIDTAIQTIQGIIPEVHDYVKKS